MVAQSNYIIVIKYNYITKNLIMNEKTQPNKIKNNNLSLYQLIRQL